MVATLGVVINLKDVLTGTIEVSNTTKRRLNVLTLIDDVLESGFLDFREGQVLRGKLAFAHAQIFGLSGRYALQQISDHVHAIPFQKRICDQLRIPLSFLEVEQWAT